MSGGDCSTAQHQAYADKKKDGETLTERRRNNIDEGVNINIMLGEKKSYFHYS